MNWTGEPTELDATTMTRCPFCGKQVEGDASSWCVLDGFYEEPWHWTAHKDSLRSVIQPWAARWLGWIS